MMRMSARFAVAMTMAVVLLTQASAAVDLTVGRPEVTRKRDGQETVQSFHLANTINSYTLVWDAVVAPERPNEVASASWAWTTGYVPLGMSAPSQPNWYLQGFFNWNFDDESLHLYNATFREIRAHGQDAMIEFAWDTPSVKATMRFAMVEGSDKLLMFGHYEPKRPIAESYVQLMCYPAFFREPRQRAVTTALGTRQPGEKIDIDLEQERWVLYEDTSEGRRGDGSAGLIIGTPDAFSNIAIPVGQYGIETKAYLVPGETDFAFGLYDFPTLPDLTATREYFGRMGDAEAVALGKIAAGDLDQPLGPMPRDEQRIADVLERGKEMFNRPAEIWRPDPEPLDFAWAKALPGEDINTVLFCHRWRAWESMELARRVGLNVDHLYFDTNDALTFARAWPYASTTGIGPIPFGVSSVRANAMATRDDVELYISAGLNSAAIPSVTQVEIMQQVEEGKGLLISGSNRAWDAWPEELMAEPDDELGDRILAGVDWRAIPGLEQSSAGWADPNRPPIRAYRYGEGRIVVLETQLNKYACFTPKNSETEGLMGAMDRMLALVARAAMFASGREPRCEITIGPDATVTVAPAPAAGSELRWRVQDDLERIIATGSVKNLGSTATISLPTLPPSRRCWLDVAAYDAAGDVLGFTFVGLPEAEAAAIGGITIEPSTLTHELSVPWVQMPDGGELQCSATIAGAVPAGATVRWEISDVFGRVLARADTPAAEQVEVTLAISRPMTVSHILNVSLQSGEQTLDYAQQRFTNPPPYPYDDFTGLMWNTASETPSLLITDRLCYEWGADMCDPANTTRGGDDECARAFDLRARSGMRLVPYATRVFGDTDESNERKPCLHDPDYVAAQIEILSANGRQAAPYAPAAYTLGDENYLDHKSATEPCYSAHTLTVFRDWLTSKYGTVARLNAAWGTNLGSIDDATPPLIGEAAKLPGNWAAWFDHKVFMDQAFTGTHDWMRETIREQDADAKVGWDGNLRYHWQAGYDFQKLSANCELNQVYVDAWIQGELVRSFAGNDALVGKWGNAVADTEAGWTAYPWHCLFDGCNSAWWWTSWGVDYVPFNPDISPSKFGEWFFPALREVNSGPGKLLLHAERDDSGVAVLYNQMDMFAAAMAARLAGKSSFADDTGLLREHEALLKGVHDAGRQFVYVIDQDVLRGRITPETYPVLILSLASCISDEMMDAIRTYVDGGGTLVVDGRAGYLDGGGNIRTTRALDEILGVTGAAGVVGFSEASVTGTLTITGELAGMDNIADLDETDAEVLEPSLVLTTGQAAGEVDGAPVLITNEFGQGRAITLNLAMNPVLRQRSMRRIQSYADIVAAALGSGGVEPYCEVTREDGQRPRCLMQAMFADGAARYLCIEQDLLALRLRDQVGRVTLPEPSIVYDVRAGKRVGEGLVSGWDVTFGRGNPLVYALLPYEVAAVTIEAPAQARAGETVTVKTSVGVTGGEAGYHVVRLDVYAPGAETPHRQYSQNIGCDSGVGNSTIPFALSDAAGQWRLALRDVASGVLAEATLTVR